MRAAMKLLIMALALQAPTGQCDSATARAISRATACVHGEATRMSRSRERAEAVATAAIARCEDQFTAVRAAINPCEGWAGGRTLDRMIRQRLRNRAIGTVVNVRTR